MVKRRIHIEPSWSFRDESGQSVDPQLFRLLRAIHAEGRLTRAAQRVGVSYRHAWNLLNKWSDFFGTDVVVLEKGRGARLTPLGDKLLWAEQRVAERLKPQMDNLVSEINIELQRIVAGAKPVVRLHASHGYAVARLPDFAHQFQLDLQYQSPTEALSALQRGACDMAGFHLPQQVQIPELLQEYQALIDMDNTVVIRFVSRQQGLMVKQGNPFKLTKVKDLVTSSIKFINRQTNSGTRSLFDQLLLDSGTQPSQVQGYSDQEFTHGAIAAYVASGMADVGFGVKAAASQFGLDFIPLAVEDYILVCRQETLEQEAIQLFLSAIRSHEFEQEIATLAGYTSQGCGEILSFEDYLNTLH